MLGVMSRAGVDMRDVVLEEVDGYGDVADPPGLRRALPWTARTAAGGSAGVWADGSAGVWAGSSAGGSPTGGSPTSGSPTSGSPTGGSPTGGSLTALGTPAIDAPDLEARTRRRRRWSAACLAVAVLIGAGALDSWRESVALAEVAESPGALDPVDGPLRELWRTEGLFLNEFDRVGGLLVGSGHGAGGEVEAVGLDPSTGEEVWATSLTPDGRETGGAQCLTPEPAGDRDEVAVTVCAVVDGVSRSDDATLPGAVQPPVGRLVVLDSATGGVLSRAPTAVGTSLATLGPDLVLGSLDDDGRLQVRRTDARGERVRWEFVSPEPLGTSEYDSWVWVQVVDGLVVAGGESGWVLSADGQPLRSWQPPPHGGWVDLVGDGLLVQPAPGDATRRAERGGGQAATWRVVDVRTAASFEVDGHPVYVPVDDGSAGDILLTQASVGGLSAYDVSDGRRRWTAPRPGRTAGAAAS